MKKQKTSDGKMRNFDLAKDRLGVRTVFEKYPVYLKIYYRHYQSLHPDFVARIDEFLADPTGEFAVAGRIFDEVVVRPEGRSPSDLMKHVTALRQLCFYYGMPVAHPLAEKMRRVFEEAAAAREAKEKRNELDPESTRDKNWVSAPRLRSILAQLVQASDACPSYQLLQQRLLLQLLILHPPWRNNFHTVHLRLLQPIELEPHHDWVYRDDALLVMHLGHDKTVDTFGREERILDSEIQVTLDKLAHYGARAYLLTGKDRDQPLGAQGARDLLASIQDREGSIRLSINNIRSAMASDYLSVPRSMADRESYAASMRTSLEMLEKFYHKIKFIYVIFVYARVYVYEFQCHVASRGRVVVYGTSILEQSWDSTLLP